jgi:hypothetical protein
MHPEFEVGPWNLGKWSPLIGWIAVGWVIFICVLFVLPPVSPVTVDTFNYAPIAVVAVLLWATFTWFIGGRKHFMHGAKDEHVTKSLDEILE